MIRPRPYRRHRRVPHGQTAWRRRRRRRRLLWTPQVFRQDGERSPTTTGTRWTKDETDDAITTEKATPRMREYSWRNKTHTGHTTRPRTRAARLLQSIADLDAQCTSWDVQEEKPMTCAPMTLRAIPTPARPGSAGICPGLAAQRAPERLETHGRIFPVSYPLPYPALGALPAWPPAVPGPAHLVRRAGAARAPP